MEHQIYTAFQRRRVIPQTRAGHGGGAGDEGRGRVANVAEFSDEFTYCKPLVP
nr:hypothetical protein Iba_scaffold14080CG0010 [Ipomoea batatas]GME15068.1 hypothetical protein Iba_scaffold15862CG0100 [Ipomoea batatas]